MDPVKELQLVRAEYPGRTPPFAEWPEVHASGVSRADLARVLLGISDGKPAEVDVPSINAETHVAALAGGGLPLTWKTSKTKSKTPEGEESAEAPTTEPNQAQSQAGFCQAKTALPAEKRILTAGALVRALLVLDAKTPPPPVTILLSGEGEDALSPAFTPKNGVKVKGDTFKSPLHYLSLAKAKLFGSPEEISAVAAAETPAEAKSRARQLSRYDDDAWRAQRAEHVVNSIIGLVRSHRPSFYQLLATGSASLRSSDAGRAHWAEGLEAVRFYILWSDFGAVIAADESARFLLSHPRLGGLPGVKAPGVRLQQLCNDCLNKTTVASFQRLLYAINHGKDLAGTVSSSGVIGLIADLLYRETTSAELVVACLSVVAALARELGTIDKEINGFLAKYYLNQRETWSALSAVDIIPYDDDVCNAALANVLGTGKFSPADRYVVAHSAKVLSKMVASNKGKRVVSTIATSHIPALVALLETTRTRCGVEGWNELQEELGVAIVKILTVAGSYLHKAAPEDPKLQFVRRLIPFIAPSVNEEIQAFVALVLEQTKQTLEPSDVDRLLSIIETDFLALELPPPDRAEPLCDLLSSLSPQNPRAATILTSLGLQHFSSWALPVLAALRNSITAKSGYATVPGFSTAAAQILRQALDNSDETAVSNLCETANILCQSAPDGTKALVEAEILSPLLQWVSEVELDVVQAEILHVCQNLTVGLAITEENQHLLELVIGLIPTVTSAEPQAIILQVLQNFANSGTPKAVFEKEVNLAALPKVIAKDNHKKLNRFLHSLGIKDAAGAATKADPKTEKQPALQGARRGEVDRYDYLEGSENPFQLLVAKPKKDSVRAREQAAQKQKAAEQKPVTVEKKEKVEPKSGALKGFTLIAVKSSKKEKQVQAAHSQTADAQRKLVSANRETKQRGGKRREYDADYDQDAPQPAEKKKAAAAPGKEVTVVGDGKVTKITASGASITTYAPKTAAASQPKERVVKLQAGGEAGGVSLSRLQQDLRASHAKAQQQRPQSWAALAKSAVDKEERDAKEREEAVQAERLAREEAQRLEAFKKKAAQQTDPVAELFKKLLPETAKVRTQVADERDMAELKEYQRAVEAKLAAQRAAELERKRQEEQRLKLEAERKEAERLAEIERKRKEEQLRLEREAQVRQQLAEAELAAQRVTRQFLPPAQEIRPPPKVDPLADRWGAPPASATAAEAIKPLGQPFSHPQGFSMPGQGSSNLATRWTANAAPEVAKPLGALSQTPQVQVGRGQPAMHSDPWGQPPAANPWQPQQPQWNSSWGHSSAQRPQQAGSQGSSVSGGAPNPYATRPAAQGPEYYNPMQRQNTPFPLNPAAGAFNRRL